MSIYLTSLNCTAARSSLERKTWLPSMICCLMRTLSSGTRLAQLCTSKRSCKGSGPPLLVHQKVNILYASRSALVFRHRTCVLPNQNLFVMDQCRKMESSDFKGSSCAAAKAKKGSETQISSILQLFVDKSDTSAAAYVVDALWESSVAMQVRLDPPHKLVSSEC